jgi:signal transduction histidine kinase
MSRLDSAATEHLWRENAQMDRRARQARQERDHLVRALSHDLSANFMLLESSFGRLKESLAGAPRAELQEIAAHVHACLDESKRFLGDLARLARTGSVEMQSTRVGLAEVVDEVLFEQRELLAQRNVRVEVARPLGHVWCNRQRVKQIVTNLIRNAIKHGCDPECPAIHVAAERAQASSRNRGGGPLVVLRIHDNGSGIEPAQRQRVFLPGVRLRGATAEGSGMGLAIVRKIAEHYGGTAWVDEHAAGGTAILVSLPSFPDRLPGADRPHASVEHDGPHGRVPNRHPLHGR